jgi:hypothetical protein
MTLSRSRLAILLSLAAGWAAPRTARACTMQVCWEGALAPAHASSVPANQTVLLVTAAQPAADPVAGSTVRLESGGVPVPFTFARRGTDLHWLITPERLIAGADYTLSYSYECGGRSPRTMTSTFSVTPAAPAPTTGGTLKLDGSGVAGEDKVNSPGNCSIDYRYAFARFSLMPSAELRPFLAVSRIVAEIDGNYTTHIPYGSSAPGATPTISLTTRCKPIGDNSLPLGKHTIEVSVEIAGGPTLTLPKQDFVLSCAEPPEGGCSLGSRRGSGPLASMAVLLVLAALLRRRTK